jgi:hypothetical protein
MPFVVSAVTAVAGAISGVLAAGGIGAALVRLGGTLLLSYASQALMPKPPLQKRSVTLREPVSPRAIWSMAAPARAVSSSSCMPPARRTAICTSWWCWPRTG